MLVRFPAMNGREIIWALAILAVTLALRKTLSRLENGEPIFPKLSLFSRRRDIREEAQSLTVTIKLCSGSMGDREERRRIIALEQQLSAAIENASAGEIDGDEYGGGACTIYIYGTSAERLLALTWPILSEFHAPPGSYLIKRYGSSDGDELRIPLNA
jgi:hypothetical protein